jgi:hypothetical protein
MKTVIATGKQKTTKDGKKQSIVKVLATHPTLNKGRNN